MSLNDMYILKVEEYFIIENKLFLIEELAEENLE